MHYNRWSLFCPPFQPFDRRRCLTAAPQTLPSMIGLFPQLGSKVCLLFFC